MTALVSVILPVFNGARTLSSAIESIRRQTCKDFECFIIDDGSTDNSGQIIEGQATEDNRIKPLYRPHKGLVSSLNLGLSRARGKYVARMDADDYSHPARLEKQIACLTENPHLGGVGCLVEFGGDRAVCRGFSHYVDWVNSLRTPEAIFMNRFVESPLVHPSMMLNKSLFDEYGPYSEGDFPEDYELWLRLMGNGVFFGKVPECLIRWNDSEQRLTRCSDRYRETAFARIKAAWLAPEVLKMAGERPVYIWGAGRSTRKRAAYLADKAIQIAGYIDVDPKKTGQRIRGCPVIDPQTIPSKRKIFVVSYVSNRGARDKIRASLNSLDYREGQDYIVAG